MNEQELEKKYMDGAGNSCPFCGSLGISGGHIEADGLDAWRRVDCDDCGKSWTELFKIIGVEFDKDDIK